MFRTFLSFFVSLIVVLAVVLGGAAGARGAAGDDPDAPWETVVGEGYAMVMPRDWTNLDKFSPQVLLYRQSDGTGGVPSKDENDQELQSQLILENIRMEPSLEESAQVVIQRILSDNDERLNTNTENVKLSDGTEAYLVTVEFRRGEKRMLIIKLLVKNSATMGYVVTGTVIASKSSNIPAANGKLGKWLKEMVKSFVKEPDKLDRQKVKKAYQERDKKR